MSCMAYGKDAVSVPWSCSALALALLVGGMKLKTGRLVLSRVTLVDRQQARILAASDSTKAPAAVSFGPDEYIYYTCP